VTAQYRVLRSLSYPLLQMRLWYVTAPFYLLLPAAVRAVYLFHLGRSWVGVWILSASLVMFTIRQNLPNYLSHGSQSVRPADHSSFYTPGNRWVVWNDPSHDQEVLAALQACDHCLTGIATAEDQNPAGASMYPNTSPANSPLERMHGPHVPRLRNIK
jgi:hypothetical protein